MPAQTFQSRLEGIAPAGCPLAPFLRYRKDVLRFNRGRNLVSRTDAGQLVERLIVESAAAAGVLPLREGEPVLDLGSGAGFPGIPFALARPVSCTLSLLDRRPVACDFLRREIARLELEGVEVWEGQADELLTREPRLRAGFDWVLMKAVAPPGDALELARPFLRPGARVVVFRDQSYRPDAATLHPRGSRRSPWEWEAALPLPGFRVAPEAPAVHLFRVRS